jgi:hypothetical protein
VLKGRQQSADLPLHVPRASRVNTTKSILQMTSALIMAASPVHRGGAATSQALSHAKPVWLVATKMMKVRTPHLARHACSIRTQQVMQ